MKFHGPAAVLLGGLLLCTNTGCSAASALFTDFRPTNAPPLRSADRMLVIGKVFQQQGQADRARALYTAALMQNPSNAEARRLLASLDAGSTPPVPPNEPATMLAEADSASGEPVTEELVTVETSTEEEESHGSDESTPVKAASVSKSEPLEVELIGEEAISAPPAAEVPTLAVEAEAAEPVGDVDTVVSVEVVETSEEELPAPLAFSFSDAAESPAAPTPAELPPPVAKADATAATADDDLFSAAGTESESVSAAEEASTPAAKVHELPAAEAVAAVPAPAEDFFSEPVVVPEPADTAVNEVAEAVNEVAEAVSEDTEAVSEDTEAVSEELTVAEPRPSVTAEEANWQKSESLGRVLELAAFPEEHSRELIDVLRHGDSMEARCLAAALLGECPREDYAVGDALKEVAESTSDMGLLLATADSQLNRRELGADVARRLIGILPDSEPATQVQLITMLRNFHGTECSEESMAALTSLLSAGDEQVRTAVALTMADFSDHPQESLDRLRRLSKEDSSAMVREAAAVSLSRLENR